MATSMLRPGGLAVGRRLNLQASNKKSLPAPPLEHTESNSKNSKELKRVRPRGSPKLGGLFHLSQVKLQEVKQTDLALKISTCFRSLGELSLC